MPNGQVSVKTIPIHTLRKANDEITRCRKSETDKNVEIYAKLIEEGGRIFEETS